MRGHKTQQQQQQQQHASHGSRPHTPHANKPQTPRADKRDLLTMNQAEVDKRLKRLRRQAKFLDACFYVPCTCQRVRLGVESLVGLVPVIGDFAGVIMSLLFVSMICGRFHTPASIKTQMFLNVALDFVIGLVPVLGDIFDILFKANMRNLELIERHVKEVRSSAQAIELGAAVPKVKAPASAYIPRIPIKKGAAGRILERTRAPAA
ncbi:hypothetical protein EV176_002799 [Coemansia sp. RSA 451]|nr:hypothetical protein EV176_002799 [Coemansia sp. RSA 451]